ncbi:hypothetical protein FKW77_003071 [Venturia effusa]|uniref:Uncharacterized protein n=1 Tax=Venturia effusa TaxID=50376 RepID=A0A517KVY6_9PEZI|nr:hypothetical protein FKW77_003071 [Venturia effusa]
MSQPSRKRVRPETSENAHQNKRRQIGSRDVDNTTFLSLPREIRQKILTIVFEDALIEDLAFMDNLAYLYNTLNRRFYPTRSHVKVPHLGKAASTLSKVHPTVKDDIPYVLNKRLAQIETYYDDRERSVGDWDYNDWNHGDREVWKAKSPRWINLMYPSSGGKECAGNLHQILRSIDGVGAGCWKRFKFHISFLCTIGWNTCDESDQEDDEMEDVEKQRHIDSTCGCGEVASGD